MDSYLSLVKAALLDICDSREVKETIEHFLFRCSIWIDYRVEMLQCIETDRGNFLFYLGGKSLFDDKNWVANIKAVQTTTQFAIATGRLDADPRAAETILTRWYCVESWTSTTIATSYSFDLPFPYRHSRWYAMPVRREYTQHPACDTWWGRGRCSSRQCADPSTPKTRKVWPSTTLPKAQVLVG